MQWVPSPRIATNGDTEYGQYRTIALPKINWGRGRLAAYSSQASFIAQFCALNDLKFASLESFFADYFGCDNEPRGIFTDEHLLPLARLIDEPLAIVKTLRNDCFALPACFGEFRCHFFEVKPDKHVSYCPACVARGYHGAFHEVPWLYRCPLHREPLKRVPVGGKSGAYVRAVAELLRCACVRWPDVWRGNFQADGVPRVAQLRHWLAVARNRTMRLRCQNAASLGESQYSLENLEILLGRLDSVVPIPTELLDLLLVSPRRQQQDKVAVARDAASAIKAVSKKISLQFLLWFFNKYEAIFSYRRSSQLLAERWIAKLEQEHTICRCDWAWDRYSGWQPIYSDEKRASWLLCPYEYAIQELKERWLIFTSSEASQRAANKIENRFIEGCRMVVENNLGYIPNPPLSLHGVQGQIAGLLLPKLTMGDNIEYVLDVLMAGQVAVHCDELTAWLSAITSDRKPIRATPAGSTNLFMDDSAAWVSTWKCLGAQSADAVARWEEGRVLWPRPPSHRTQYSTP